MLFENMNSRVMKDVTKESTPLYLFDNDPQQC